MHYTKSYFTLPYYIRLYYIIFYYTLVYHTILYSTMVPRRPPHAAQNKWRAFLPLKAVFPRNTPIPIQVRNQFVRLCVLLLFFAFVCLFVCTMTDNHRNCMSCLNFVVASLRILLFDKTRILALLKYTKRMGGPSFLDIRQFTTEVKLACKSPFNCGT